MGETCLLLRHWFYKRLRLQYVDEVGLWNLVLTKTCHTIKIIVPPKWNPERHAQCIPVRLINGLGLFHRPISKLGVCACMCACVKRAAVYVTHFRRRTDLKNSIGSLLYSLANSERTKETTGWKKVSEKKQKRSKTRTERRRQNSLEQISTGNEHFYFFTG